MKQRVTVELLIDPLDAPAAAVDQAVTQGMPEYLQACWAYTNSGFEVKVEKVTILKREYVDG